MSWKQLAPVRVELSTDKLNPDGMGTVNGSVSDPDSFSNLVKYDFDKDGVDEIVVVGKYWSCFVTEKGCDGKPTQRYVLMVLKRRLLLTDMHRWNDWEVIEMRTDYVVRNVFVAKADDGVRVVSAENSAQCDMDRMDEFKLVWNPAKKKVVASDPTKTSLFNLEPHGYCGE